jgi:hypothetical protein
MWRTFYITRDGGQLGPFTENELRSKIEAGEISGSDQAWTEGLTGWLPLGEILPEIDAVVCSSASFRSTTPVFPPGFSPKQRWIYRMTGPVAELEDYEDKVVIPTSGVMRILNRGLKGAKSIPFHSITAIQFKRGGLTRGYIQFTIPGGNESRGGVFDAVADENTFLFDEAQTSEAETIKNYIESRIQEIRTPQSRSNEPSNLADELTKLATLKAQGLLTDEEFQTAKKRLLG